MRYCTAKRWHRMSAILAGYFASVPKEERRSQAQGRICTVAACVRGARLHAVSPHALCVLRERLSRLSKRI